MLLPQSGAFSRWNVTSISFVEKTFILKTGFDSKLKGKVKTVAASMTPIPISLLSPDVNCPTKAEAFVASDNGFATLAKVEEVFQLLKTMLGLFESKSTCVTSCAFITLKAKIKSKVIFFIIKFLIKLIVM